MKLSRRYLISSVAFTFISVLIIASHQLADKASFCAVVRPSPLNEKKFQIISNSCEHCDEVLHKYNCGAGSVFERQILADVTQVDKRLPEAGVDARALKLEVPFIASYTSTRTVWCPRFPRDSNKHVNDYIFRTRLPEWNTELGSLVMKFVERRVTEASSKNILIVLSDGIETVIFYDITFPIYLILFCSRYSCDAIWKSKERYL